jgi:hypothetical protein
MTSAPDALLASARIERRFLVLSQRVREESTAPMLHYDERTGGQRVLGSNE